MNSVDDIDASALGYAGLVYEHVLGENKFVSTVVAYHSGTRLWRRWRTPRASRS